MKRIVLGLFLLATFVTANAADRKYINIPRPSNSATLPFSDGVLIMNTLYVSGHLGLTSQGTPADTPEEEAKLAMEGVKDTVKAAGMKMEDIVNVQVFCTDLKLYDTFNTVYKTYFKDNFPARSFIGTDKLLRGAHFEVLAVAIKRKG